MRPGLRRGLADLACRALLCILPRSLQSWGWAVRRETAEIPDHGKALLFALGGLFGLIPRALKIRLLSLAVGETDSSTHFDRDPIMMKMCKNAVRSPRMAGIICAIGAVLLGLAYLVIAGAPVHYAGINIGALLIGSMLLALCASVKHERQLQFSVMGVIIAVVLMGTAVLGDDIDGVSRWVNIGGLSIQPGLILIPPMMIAFARSRNAFTTAAMMIAAAALAMMPDRSLAGMLVTGLAVMAAMRPDRYILAALVVGITGLAAAFVQADTLPAIPYVEQVYYSSFAVDVLAGIAVLGGSVLLIVPAVIGWCYDAESRNIYAVFGAVWLSAIAAAALGNYPTPLVGYGGSAIIGYVLSLAVFPRPVRKRNGVGPRLYCENSEQPHDRHLLTGLV